MNCFESRRRLLIAPRERIDDHEAHISTCAACTRLVTDLAALDRKMNKATRISVPDGLADRILIARSYSAHRYSVGGIAAAVLVAAISSITLLPGILESAEPTLAADAVGPAHPAVAAISLVAQRELGQSHPGSADDAAAIKDRLKFLGLVLKTKGVSAQYMGKCDLAGRECDRLVLDTPEGQVTVILMAHEQPSARVLVADQRMTALMSPAPTGAYIVVAGSPKAARSAQKLFVRG